MTNLLAPDTPTLPQGPIFFAAPSALANNVVPSDPTLAALIGLGRQLHEGNGRLADLLDNKLPDAAKAFSGAIVAVNALAGIADAMDDSFQGASFPNFPDVPGKAKTLRQKADALATAVQNKTGGGVDVRKFVAQLDADIRQEETNLVNLLRSSMNIVQKFADSGLPDVDHFVELSALNFIMAESAALLARGSKAEEIDRIAQEVLEQHDQKQSVPAVSIAAANKFWDGFVAAAQTHGAAVGALPGPDSLSIALIKIWVANRMTQVALNATASSDLERTVLSMVMSAVKLPPADEQKLRGLLDDLVRAQKKVIDLAKDEVAARRAGADPATIEAKSQAREAAEVDCGFEAELTRVYVEGTFDPAKNPGIFNNVQRGKFIDGFCSVLSIIQLIAALREVRDPDVLTVHNAQVFADMASSGLLTFGAVVSTVGRMGANIKVNVVVLKVLLGHIADFVKSGMFSFFVAGAIILSGLLQMVTGKTTEQRVVGGVVTASGLAILIGTSLSGDMVAVGAAFTGFGAALSALLAIYSLWGVLSEATKTPTEVAIGGLLDGLEQTKVYTHQTAIEHLGLASDLKNVRDSLSDACWNIIPQSGGDRLLAVEAIIRRLMPLGISREDAASLVEDDLGARGRLSLRTFD